MDGLLICAAIGIFYFLEKTQEKGFTNAAISSIILKVICACSSVDRALASGARCVGSIPIRRIEKCFTASSGGAFCFIGG